MCIETKSQEGKQMETAFSLRETPRFKRTYSRLIKEISKEIMVAYAHHVRDRVREEDFEYLASGVDNSLEKYTNLFKVTLSMLTGLDFGVEDTYPSHVTMDTMHVLNSKVLSKGYERYISNPVIGEGVYKVCMLILKKVKEEEFDSSFVTNLQ